MSFGETEAILTPNQGAESGRPDIDLGSTLYHEATQAIGEPYGGQ